MEQQKLIFQDFLASLPPAALELLQLIYDSNSDLTRELERRKAEIKQLKQTHAAALQQKDQQLDQLKALIYRLQQQPSAAAVLAQQTEQGGLDGGHSAPAPNVSPSTCSAGGLQGEHAVADAFVASTKKRRAAADESGQPADETGLQDGEFMHVQRPAQPHVKRVYTGLGGQDSLAAAAAEPEQAAGTSASPEAAAAGARSMRVLPAGTHKLAGSNSTTPTKPPGQQQQQQPAGQAARSAHPSKDATASAPLAPTSLRLVLAAAMQTAGSVPSGAAAGQGQSAGQPAQAMQEAAERDAGDMSDAEQGTSAGDVEDDLDAADLLFFAAADPSTAQQQGQQEPQRRPVIQPAHQNPVAGPIPQAGFDAQEAFATILGYLQTHGSVGNNAVRGPSSAGGARAPGSAGAAAYGVGGSDGGSAASAFHPARPASAAGAAPRVDGQHFAHGVMSLSPAGPGAAGRSSAAGAAADLAAASAAVAQAAAQQQLGSNMPFGFSGPSHGVHASAGYGHPSMQGHSASLQHMLGSLGYAGPTSALQQSTAAQAYGYPGASAGAAGAAGQAYGYQGAAAAPAGVGYGGAWEGWQQMQSMQGGMIGAAGAGADMLAGMQQMAPGRRSLGSSAGGGSTAPARRGSKGTKSAASAGDPDDPPESAGESNWRRELERQVPPNVRQAIREAWLAQPEPRELPINCNGFEGTFFVSATKECFIRNAAGQMVRPTQFERDCGIAQRKDWQRSIRVPGYEGKNGPIRLGHFVRIVGISTSRRNSSA